MMDANDATPRHEPDIAGVDHSVVTDPLVGEALGKLLTAWRMRKRWDDFPSDHRAVHHHPRLGARTWPGSRAAISAQCSKI